MHTRLASVTGAADTQPERLASGRVRPILRRSTGRYPQRRRRWLRRFGSKSPPPEQHAERPRPSLVLGTPQTSTKSATAGLGCAPCSTGQTSLSASEVAALLCNGSKRGYRLCQTMVRSPGRRPGEGSRGYFIAGDPRCTQLYYYSLAAAWPYL